MFDLVPPFHPVHVLGLHPLYIRQDPGVHTRGNKPVKLHQKTELTNSVLKYLLHRFSFLKGKVQMENLNLKINAKSFALGMLLVTLAKTSRHTCF
jgi:hypothetical protein